VQLPNIPISPCHVPWPKQDQMVSGLLRFGEERKQLLSNEIGGVVNYPVGGARRHSYLKLLPCFLQSDTACCCTHRSLCAQSKNRHGQLGFCSFTIAICIVEQRAVVAQVSSQRSRLRVDSHVLVDLFCADRRRVITNTVEAGGKNGQVLSLAARDQCLGNVGRHVENGVPLPALPRKSVSVFSTEARDRHVQNRESSHLGSITHGVREPDGRAPVVTSDVDAIESQTTYELMDVFRGSMGIVPTGRLR